MSPGAIAAIVAGSGVIVSWIGSAFIAGYRWGTVKTRLDILESNFGALATKDQLAGMKEDLAEVKGMFRMVPRDIKDTLG